MVVLVGAWCSPCAYSLDDLGTGHPRTFAAAVAHAEELGMECQPYFLRIEIGTCDALRYVSIGDGYGGGTHIYGEDGMLVAYRGYGDTPDDNGCYSYNAGDVPDCIRVPTKVICRGEFP